MLRGICELLAGRSMEHRAAGGGDKTGRLCRVRRTYGVRVHVWLRWYCLNVVFISVYKIGHDVFLESCCQFVLTRATCACLTLLSAQPNTLVVFIRFGKCAVGTSIRNAAMIGPILK
jgi:hypothetical protein